MKLTIMFVVAIGLAALAGYHFGHWYGRLAGMAELTKDIRFPLK